MPRVPVTLPVADKVPVPRSLEVLRGVPMTGVGSPLEVNEGEVLWLLLRLGVWWLGPTPRRTP